jgi:hypothetical protein
MMRMVDVMTWGKRTEMRIETNNGVKEREKNEEKEEKLIFL